MSEKDQVAPLIESSANPTVTAEPVVPPSTNKTPSNPKGEDKPVKKQPEPKVGRIITITVIDGKATLRDELDGEEQLNLSFPDVPHRLRSILEMNDAEIKRITS